MDERVPARQNTGPFFRRCEVRAEGVTLREVAECPCESCG